MSEQISDHPLYPIASDRGSITPLWNDYTESGTVPCWVVPMSHPNSVVMAQILPVFKYARIVLGTQDSCTTWVVRDGFVFAAIGYTVSRLRPFARRALRTCLPAFVAIRARKP